MKKLSFLLLSSLAFSVIAFSQATPTTMQHGDGAVHTMINKNEIKWGDGPAALPAGVRMAVLTGDPGKEGPFTLRVMFPANFKIPAHWHPTTENVLVLSGTLYMGSGEKFTETG